MPSTTLQAGARLLLSAPEEVNLVLLKGVIGGEDDHIFSLRLGNQRSIKRVAMVRR